MMGHAARVASRARGQSLVEFTLALPVFMLVLLAIAEGGYYVGATTIVSHATQEGARLGVLASTADRDAIRVRVKDSAAAIVSLADGDIDVQLNGVACDDACYEGRSKGDRLTVETDYTHRPLVGYVLGNIAFSADAEAELYVEGGP